MMKKTLVQAPRIKFSDLFNRRLKTAPREIRSAFFGTLQLLVDDPANPFLRDHALKDKFAGLRSIDVTQDWRALYKPETGWVITFVDLGTHQHLYG